MHTLNRRALFLLLSVGLLLSCDDDFLDGFNRAELFAAPSQSELDAVRADWATRELMPTDYRIEQQAEVANGTVLKIISFRLGNLREYGALLVPKSNIALPVRMFINGFGLGNTVNAIRLEISSATFNSPYVFAIPALRGQSLSITVNGTEYTTPVSEGIHCDAFDRAADDAIAFLNAIERMENKADVNRVAVRGGSRGATVALLVGERDERVKMAFAVAGPTNLLELTSVNENDLTYQCQFLDALVGGGATIDDVRHSLIASSPLFFAEHLPKTQVHAAQADTIVPVSQGEELKYKMEELGLESRFELFIYPGRDHATIGSDNQELNDRIARLLAEL